MWTVDRSYNSQNDRYIATMKSNVPPVQTTKFPASVMTLVVIGSNRAVMPPHFFRPKEKVGADTYCDVLELVVIPWMKDVAGDTNFVFQQDSIPAHTAKKTVNMLKSNNVLFWDSHTWPPTPPT